MSWQTIVYRIESFVQVVPTVLYTVVLIDYAALAQVIYDDPWSWSIKAFTMNLYLYYFTL
jgi:hypothetical protein